MGSWEYDRKHCKFYFIKLNKRTDAQIIEKLESEPNKQGYIKGLIKEDMKNEAKKNAHKGSRIYVCTACKA